jgi:DnaJ-class molecular chaperone
MSNAFIIFTHFANMHCASFTCFYLSFSRNAQKQEILKAYRKLAAQWHPDQYNGDDKQHAEKMFIDIAAAKEVLTDPGMLLS